MDSIAHNLPDGRRGQLLLPAPLSDANELFFGLVECLPRSTRAPDRLSGDALCILGAFIHSRDADTWTVPISRAELAKFFRYQWSAGRTYRLVDELLRRGFLESREYVVHARGGWHRWTRFRVRSRSERLSDAHAIARRRCHR